MTKKSHNFYKPDRESHIFYKIIKSNIGIKGFSSSFIQIALATQALREQSESNEWLV